MIPVKIQCGCGQKYAFEIEQPTTFPPRSVTCPVCGADGTALANQSIAQRLAPARAAATVANAAPAMAMSSGAPITPAAPIAVPQTPTRPPAPTLVAQPATTPSVRVAPAAAPVAAPTVARVSSAPAPTPAGHGAPGGTPLPGRLDRDRAIAEARSKIMWGDDQKDVAAFLRMQGLPSAEAAQVVADLLNERASTIRAEGVAKITKGCACICVPIIAFFSFLSIGYMPIKIMGVTVMIGCYGLYLLINGLVMFLSPRSESGDVADK